MSKMYFGFALASSMFNGNCRIVRRVLSPYEAKAYIDEGVIPCINPSHAATIAAMRERFRIDMPIPGKPPSVCLNPGDGVIVMGVRGLPRLTDRHEYSPEEISGAVFEFVFYWVEPQEGVQEGVLDNINPLLG